MGCQISKKTGDGADANYTAELCSYEVACQLDPVLRSFDATLQQRTNRAISSLSEGASSHSLSLESLREVTGCLFDVNQDVVEMILECKSDIWKNKELSDLVAEYFESSLKTLDFCAVLEKCVNRARDSQFIVQVALQLFEDELQNQDDKQNVYTKTLQQLNKFKATGEPFTDEFFSVFQSVYKQQVSMLQKLRRRRIKLDKKIKSLQTWRTVSNILFIAAFTSVMIFSIVAAALAAPPLLTAVAGALAVPIGSVGKWVQSLWKGYENALTGQREIVSLMHVSTTIRIKDLDNVRVLVDKFNIEIESILQNADFALSDPDALLLVMEEIKKNLNVFMETIEVLSEHAKKCRRDITKARTIVLQRIIKHPSNSI